MNEAKTIDGMNQSQTGIQGWTCLTCGAFVINGAIHVCQIGGAVGYPVNYCPPNPCCFSSCQWARKCKKGVPPTYFEGKE
jgi:hypothetical protein